jgi:probable F420-dependent oxidoreductase
VRRAVAAPCFAEDPAELVELAVAAERAGFDGFFLWDHILFANDGEGPQIVDPWLVLALIAARTSRIVLGTMITPVSRRRPWVLARQTATLDIISGGRLILGVGLGSPAHGDFAAFGDEADPKVRGELLDEGLAVLAGLWSGERFSFTGRHFRLEEMRFVPPPVQRPRIPVWVGGVLPNPAPLRRAARWDGWVPIRWVDGVLTRPAVADIAVASQAVTAARGSLEGYDFAVWAEVAPSPERLLDELAEYRAAGATWWIETARPGDGWRQGLLDRIAAGVG